MFVVRNKKTKAVHFFSDKKIIMVYLKREDASTAIQAYRGINQLVGKQEFEIVPVKVVEKKE